MGGNPSYPACIAARGQRSLHKYLMMLDMMYTLARRRRDVDGHQIGLLLPQHTIVSGKRTYAVLWK